MIRGAPRVVVIGAGMGGLAASIDLARCGAAVTLLERAAAPGGKVRALDVAGRAIDTGPTVFTMRWIFESLFRDAGAALVERLGLAPLDVLAGHGWLDGSRLDLYADVERSAAAIRDFAGAAEADAYRTFARRSEAIFDTLDAAFMRREKPSLLGLPLSMGPKGPFRLLATKPFTSLWSELERSFSDPRLRQLFGRYATYTGSSPWAAPATLMLIAHAERAGVWTVSGGMPRLAAAMAELATELGAELRCGCGAARIVTAKGRVRGVETATGEMLAADAVVFNGDVAALTQGLLGADVHAALAPRRRARSLSAITWSLVGRVTGFPLHHHTILFGSDYRDEFRAVFERGEVTAEPTVYLCAQERGATGAQAQAAAEPASEPAGEPLFLLVNAPPAGPGAAPLGEAVLDAVEERTFRLLERHGLRLDVEASERLGPADWARRFPGSDGAIYGWPTHGWNGSFERAGARGRIAGLYFAGGTVHPGPGIPMATQSGRIAAGRLLKDLGRQAGR